MPAGQKISGPGHRKGGGGFESIQATPEQPLFGLMRAIRARAENFPGGTMKAKNQGRLRPTVRDPVAILTEIANDLDAPATARVAAAKALLLAGKTRPPEDADAALDDVTR